MSGYRLETDLQKAKIFKQSLNKVNSKKYPHILNLKSMRLGVNTLMKLISILQSQQFKELNLADNSISEYGMHAVKNIINSTKIEILNLASNMISQVGLSLILEDFIKNNHIKELNLGIEEGSIRKNSFGIDGARCLAAVLLQNKTLQVLKLEDNDIGINGAEIISIPLKKNKKLKQLKISQNLIKTEGAEYILLNAINLTSLDFGKNFIKSSIGPSLKKYVQVNKNLRKINLQYNQLMAEGVQIFFEGLINSQIQYINLRGNSIGDRGIAMIQHNILLWDRQVPSLTTLNLSANQITKQGIRPLISIINCCRIKSLNLSKNILGDEGVMQLIDNLKETVAGQIIQKLDFSSSKVSDRGFMHLVQNITHLPQLRFLKVADSYISQKYQKIYADLLQKNTTLILLNLQGNRLSLSGMKTIKKIIQRNYKDYQQSGPKKMKSQLLNLKQKKKKIQQAQAKIEKQKKEIQKLQQTRAKLLQNVTRLEREERERRLEHDEVVRKRTQQLQTLVQNSDNKVQALERIKEEKQKNIEQVNIQLSRLREKRKQLQYQLTVTQNQSETIEKQFVKKANKIK